MKTVWILGDQLSLHNAALNEADKKTSVVLMVESKARSQRVVYHKKKLVLIFSAMRHFARDLRDRGWQVDYHALTDTPEFGVGLQRHIETFAPEEVLLTEPNDWPMMETAKQLPVRLVPTGQFISTRAGFQKWAGQSKRLLMEMHYRRLRNETGYLMNDGEPEGGQWNYDASNRSTYADWHRQAEPRPEPPSVLPDPITEGVMKMVEDVFPENPGRAEGFWLPVDREHALEWLDGFIRHRLIRFGSFEDLMVQGEPVHFHSVLSPLLNLGLLTPHECIEAAIDAYHRKEAPLNSVEGFVRQILGWREFINGVYWLKMPDYKQSNYLNAQLPLPRFFYTGDTEMNCLRQVIKQVLNLGYNHHIQRLMVLGNFFLIAGVIPQEAERWYLEMYVDAYDWVMAANVLGMILYADGGYMATKPYAAGGSYINKMSNYCRDCRFKPTVKVGPDACPYNYLYWNFYDRHQDELQDNPRVSMMVRGWRNRPEAEKRQVRDSAQAFLEGLQA
ncbi:MAG TPA: cryptochrome/photolyase family protein [Chthoniobacterales bacterium]